MFENKENSIFENNDEFGVQEYREGSNYLFSQNLTTVKLIKWNKRKSETLQGDFLGTTVLADANKQDFDSIININIMSLNPKEKELSEFGFDDKGTITYECFAFWDLDISSKDIIEFILPYGKEIVQGERFKVKMDDAGVYQGQYTRKQFTMTKIQDSLNNG